MRAAVKTRTLPSLNSQQFSRKQQKGTTYIPKPRVTKADRALMELEKIERERMATKLKAAPPAKAEDQV